LVLSPIGLINLGFTTEGRLAIVLIITFSWGFHLGGYIYNTSTSTPHHQQVFWRRCRGPKKKKLPCQLRASKTPNKFSGAVAGEKEDFRKGSLSLPIFYFVIVLLYFIFACIMMSTHASVLVDSVGPPSAEVCRAAASFP
jgi:hypothetical protein